MSGLDRNMGDFVKNKVYWSVPIATWAARCHRSLADIGHQAMLKCLVLYCQFCVTTLVGI